MTCDLALVGKKTRQKGGMTCDLALVGKKKILTSSVGKIKLVLGTKS